MRANHGFQGLYHVGALAVGGRRRVGAVVAVVVVGVFAGGSVGSSVFCCVAPDGSRSGLVAELISALPSPLAGSFPSCPFAVSRGTLSRSSCPSPETSFFFFSLSLRLTFFSRFRRVRFSCSDSCVAFTWAAMSARKARRRRSRMRRFLDGLLRLSLEAA